MAKKNIHIPAAVMTALGDIKPMPNNPRIITAKAFKDLLASIQSVGFIENIVAKKDGTIIGGHQRYEAAKKLGIEQVPVVFLDITDTQAKALNIALNHIEGEDEEQALAEMVFAISQEDPDLLAHIGLEDKTIQAILDSGSAAQEPTDQTEAAGLEKRIFELSPQQAKTLDKFLNKMVKDELFDLDPLNENPKSCALMFAVKEWAIETN